MNTVGAPNGRGPRFLEPAEPPIATPLIMVMRVIIYQYNLRDRHDLISSFHDSVASPGNELRGAQYEFSSPPLPGILFSSETVFFLFT